VENAQNLVANLTISYRPNHTEYNIYCSKTPQAITARPPGKEGQSQGEFFQYDTGGSG
jgi:hypothetical protein